MRHQSLISIKYRYVKLAFTFVGIKKMFHEITLKRLYVKFFLKEYYVSNSSHPNRDCQILAIQIIPGDKM